MRHSITPCRWRASGLVGALLLVAAAGCVSRGAYNEVVGERDRLDRELKRLTATAESLDAERVQLLEEMEDLRHERETLDRDVRRLRRAEAELSKTLANREAELTKRKQELNQLRGTYQTLVSDLESEVAAGQIEIEQLREGLRLNVAQNILFASGSARLNASGERVLRKVAQQLKTVPHRVQVQGHTDNIPIAQTARFPSNWELAAARASSVVRLLAEEGVDPTRMRAESYGEHRPVAGNDTPEGRLKNRRIEIRLQPAEPAQLPARAGAESDS